MKKLTKLTKEQLASLPVIAQDWIKTITTGETDEEGCKKAIHQIYKRGKLTPPKYIFFFDDPIQCLWGRFYAAIYIAIAEGKLKLSDLKKFKIKGAQVYAQVDAQVDAQVRAHKNLMQWPSFSIWWSSWRKYREVLIQFLGEEFLGDGWIALDRARASWTWCYPNIAIICRMPKIWRDESSNLHRDDGPALLYPSGLGWYFHHGVRVNKKIILHPETITKEEILNEKNEEVKRAMIERIGEESFVKMMKFEVISEDKFGSLIQTKLGDEIYMSAHVLCPSTGREYYLPVPSTFEEAINSIDKRNPPVGWEEWTEADEKKIWPQDGKMKTCRQGLAWTFGFKESDYAPLIET